MYLPPALLRVSLNVHSVSIPTKLEYVGGVIPTVKYALDQLLPPALFVRLPCTSRSAYQVAPFCLLIPRACLIQVPLFWHKNIVMIAMRNAEGVQAIRLSSVRRVLMLVI